MDAMDDVLVCFSRAYVSGKERVLSAQLPSCATFSLLHFVPHLPSSLRSRCLRSRSCSDTRECCNNLMSIDTESTELSIQDCLRAERSPPRRWQRTHLGWPRWNCASDQTG